MKSQTADKRVITPQKSPLTNGCRLEDLPKPLEQLSESEIERKQCISRVMTRTLEYLACKLTDEGFEWLLPVMFSRSTDPLWPDPGASIEKRVEVEIYEKTVRTTLSMIIHKIVACSLAFPKLFIISPNARIERRDRATSGRHAYEFTQLDFELRDATSKDVRSLVEGLVSGLITNLRSSARNELVRLGRFESLRIPKTPFKVYDRKELEDGFAENHETQLPMKISDPVWVTNIPREFYDFEDFESGVWDNYDLILPQCGEVLSGARREWEFEKIARKMKRDGVAAQNYEQYLKMAKEGRIRSTAGAGIGLERLVSWLTGAKHVGETQPFPRIPGIVYDL